LKDYRAIFEKIEASLIEAGSENLPKETIKANLDDFKGYESRLLSDADYYWIFIYVVFYSGFKAAIVNAKLEVIRKHFPDYETVSNYTENNILKILSDPAMIKNKVKIAACVENASVFKSIISEYGTFRAYVDSFEPKASFENLMLLKEELEYRFGGLGRITTYHFLTDIGMPVLKPDRVIGRIFQRLGLIENEDQLLKTVIQGRKFADATGHPIRYIDIVFVAYGQMMSLDFGLKSGICLEQKPLCSICGVTEQCNYFANKEV
jgi:DNA-3-methyladenine glycosylase I